MARSCKDLMDMLEEKLLEHRSSCEAELNEHIASNIVAFADLDATTSVAKAEFMRRLGDVFSVIAQNRDVIALQAEQQAAVWADESRHFMKLANAESKGCLVDLLPTIASTLEHAGTTVSHVEQALHSERIYEGAHEASVDCNRALTRLRLDAEQMKQNRAVIEALTTRSDSSMP